MFEHSVINVKYAVEIGKLITMINNGTGYCNVVLLNPLSETVIMKELWTDSKDDPVLFYVGEELQFNFTKYDTVKFDNTTLKLGKQHFSLPARKSFSVQLSRIS